MLWKEHPTKPDRPETWKDYKIDDYIEDGDKITLGEKTIYVYGTPGHTPGGLSYIFPVKEDGEIHMAALWGGTTPPWTKNEVKQYLKSLDYFISEAIRKKVDVALSNHTAVDNGLKRIMYSKTRMNYMPNIYIMGQDGFQNYCPDKVNLSITISIGVSTYPDTTNKIYDLLEDADKALYEAKRTGRNKVVLYKKDNHQN